MLIILINFVKNVACSNSLSISFVPLRSMGRTREPFSTSKRKKCYKNQNLLMGHRKQSKNASLLLKVKPYFFLSEPHPFSHRHPYIFTGTAQRNKRGDTEYCFSFIPLGGYVKMYGDDPMKMDEIPEEERKYSFTFKSKLARFWIVFGGPE